MKQAQKNKVREDARRFQTMLEHRDEAAAHAIATQVHAWAALPAASRRTAIQVREFGGFGHQQVFRQVAHCLRMGDLRRLMPESYGPCRNVLTDFSDNHEIILPTVADVSGAVWRVTMQMMSLQLSLIAGAAAIKAQGRVLSPVKLRFHRDDEPPHSQWGACSPHGPEDEQRLLLLLTSVAEQVNPEDIFSSWPAAISDALRLQHKEKQTMEYKMPLHQCVRCGSLRAGMMKCGRCLRARYCDRLCQTSHWPTHKASCGACSFSE